LQDRRTRGHFTSNHKRTFMIAVIDYGAGNTQSVVNVLDELNVEYIVTSREDLGPGLGKATGELGEGLGTTTGEIGKGTGKTIGDLGPGLGKTNGKLGGGLGNGKIGGGKKKKLSDLGKTSEEPGIGKLEVQG